MYPYDFLMFLNGFICFHIDSLSLVLSDSIRQILSQSHNPEKRPLLIFSLSRTVNSKLVR